MILFSNYQQSQVFLLHYPYFSLPGPVGRVWGGAIAQRMHLALSGPSISRKRHENVMSSVMNSNMGSGPKRYPTPERERVWQQDPRPQPQSDQPSFPPSFWSEEMLSI